MRQEKQEIARVCVYLYVCMCVSGQKNQRQ